MICTLPLVEPSGGKVVAPVAPVAEPGRIARLITTYGCANAHMAIRAAELCIPAVLGGKSIEWFKGYHTNRPGRPVSQGMMLPVSRAG